MRNAMFLVAALVAIAPHAAIAKRVQSIAISGNYASNWGAVTLSQQGDHVSGTYVFQDGRLEGTLDGTIVRYRWTEKDSSGRGVFVVASDGELIGTWGVGSDDIGGGGWRLVPGKSAIAQN